MEHEEDVRKRCGVVTCLPNSGEQLGHRRIHRRRHGGAGHRHLCARNGHAAGCCHLGLECWGWPARERLAREPPGSALPAEIRPRQQRRPRAAAGIARRRGANGLGSHAVAARGAGATPRGSPQTSVSLEPQHACAGTRPTHGHRCAAGCASACGCWLPRAPLLPSCLGRRELRPSAARRAALAGFPAPHEQQCEPHQRQHERGALRADGKRGCCGQAAWPSRVAKPRGQAAWRAGRRCPGSAAKAKHILRSRHAKRTPPRPQSSSTASKATPFRVQACGGVSSPQHSGTLNSTRARAASEKTGHTKRLPRGRHRTRPDHTAS